MAAKAKKLLTYEEQVLATIEEQLVVLDKDLDYRPINLERGSFVDGTISFGSLPIDLITGGGAPPGKWTDIFGPESSGKSTIIYHLIVDAQAQGIPVIFYDHECGSDPIYMRSIGIKFRDAAGNRIQGFHYFQPDNGDFTYRHINRLVRALPDFEPMESGSRPKPALLILIDSLDAMISGAIVDNDQDNRRGLQARMHGDGMRLVKGALGRKNVCVVSTNQLKLAPGTNFGNPEYEPGGQAVKFYPDLKIRIQSVGKVEKERGRDIKFTNVRTIKNKQFTPFRILHNSQWTAPAIAFGRGFERGYDTYAYLILTDQVSDNGRGHYVLALHKPTKTVEEWADSGVKWAGLMEILCTDEMRDFCRGQIENGVAFERYFKHEQIETPLLDQTDSGVSEDVERLQVRQTCGSCKHFKICQVEYKVKASNTAEELDCADYSPNIEIEPSDIDLATDQEPKPAVRA